jgi:hypothetical protein
MARSGRPPRPIPDHERTMSSGSGQARLLAPAGLFPPSEVKSSLTSSRSHWPRQEPGRLPQLLTCDCCLTATGRTKAGIHPTAPRRRSCQRQVFFGVRAQSSTWPAPPAGVLRGCGEAGISIAKAIRLFLALGKDGAETKRKIHLRAFLLFLSHGPASAPERCWRAPTQPFCRFLPGPDNIVTDINGNA